MTRIVTDAEAADMKLHLTHELDFRTVGEDYALALLDTREALKDAVKVYTSEHHGCDRRRCTCGAYSTLTDLLSQLKGES